MGRTVIAGRWSALGAALARSLLGARAPVAAARRPLDLPDLSALARVRNDPQSAPAIECAGVLGRQGDEYL